MENANSGFQVIFRIGSKTTRIFSDPAIDAMLSSLKTVEEQQYSEDGIGIYAFDLYREHSGRSDLSFAEFVNLNLEMDFWTEKNDFRVSISEEIARKSGLFNYRSRFICWVSHKILQEFEVVELSSVDTEKKFLRVTLDFNKLVQAWVEAGTPESWK